MVKEIGKNFLTGEVAKFSFSGIGYALAKPLSLGSSLVLTDNLVSGFERHPELVYPALGVLALSHIIPAVMSYQLMKKDGQSMSLNSNVILKITNAVLAFLHAEGNKKLNAATIATVGVVFDLFALSPWDPSGGKAIFDSLTNQDSTILLSQRVISGIANSAIKIPGNIVYMKEMQENERRKEGAPPLETKWVI